MKWIDISVERPNLYTMYLITDGKEVCPGYFTDEGTCGTAVVPYKVDKGTRTWLNMHKPLVPTHYMHMPNAPTNLLPESTNSVGKQEEILDKKCKEFLDEATEETLESLLEETYHARTVNAPQV